MTQLTTLNAQFSSDIIDRLNEIAEKQKRSRSDIIHEAVESYLDSLAWLEDAIMKAEDDFNAGRVISHEDMKRRYRKLGVSSSSLH